MALISDPQAWLSFLILAVLEIVLGIDNIIFLVVLVERLPPPQRRSARLIGLSVAMLTRIALLFSVTWLATLTATLFSIYGDEISGRDLILFGGGAFLVVKAVMEIRDMLRDLPETVRSAMVVGHNPGLHELALILAGAGGKPEQQRLNEGFPTAAMAEFLVTTPWRRLGAGPATLQRLVVPQDIL